VYIVDPSRVLIQKPNHPHDVLWLMSGTDSWSVKLLDIGTTYWWVWFQSYRYFRWTDFKLLDVVKQTGCGFGQR